MRWLPAGGDFGGGESERKRDLRCSFSLSAGPALGSALYDDAKPPKCICEGATAIRDC